MLQRRVTILLLVVLGGGGGGGGAGAAAAAAAGSMLTGKKSSSTTMTLCPENCQCVRRKIIPIERPNQFIINPIDIIVKPKKMNDNDKSETTTMMMMVEVRCKGTVPSIKSLPSNIQRLVVQETKARAIMAMLLELENMNKSSSRMINNKIGLRELGIINCSLTRLDVKLSQLSSHHSSYNIISLNLSSNLIGETQQLMVRDAESNNENRLGQLDLSNNRLSRIRTKAFANYGQLVKLNLARNTIIIVEKGGLVGLGSLEILDLSDNRLVTLDEDSFVPLTYLQKLNLSGNRLLMGVLGLGHRWFDNLIRLRELDVSRNKLSRASHNDDDEEEQQRRRRLQRRWRQQIKDKDIKDIGVWAGIEPPPSLVLGSVSRRLEIIDASDIGLDRVPSTLTRSVRCVNLAGNRLSLISSGDFDSYPLLKVLNLSSNNISLIENDALGRLEILDKLILSENRLDKLPESLPTNLVDLEICHNFIDKIRTKDVQGLVKLERLIISNNVIREIEEGSIGQLLHLRELDISYNPIKKLPANRLSGPSLVTLRMSGLWSLARESGEEGEERADMAFPVPTPERLVSLDISSSPVLAGQLLADDAALSACKSLKILNIAQTNLTTLRSDLPYLLPQLDTLGLFDNQWNCTRANREIIWLPKWIKENEEILPRAKCRITDNDNDNDTITILLIDHSSSILLESPLVNDNCDNQSLTIIAPAAQSLGEQLFIKDESSSKFQLFSITIETHPGMLILAGAVLGSLAIIGFALLLSHRRLGIIIINNDNKNNHHHYHHDDNITILPSIVSNFISNQQPAILTELW